MERSKHVLHLVIFLVCLTAAGVTAVFAAGPGRNDAPQRDPASNALSTLAWEQANSSGFGTQNATEVSAVDTFDGYLFAATQNITDSARIYRSATGTAWTAVIDPGFGNPHDTAPPAILDFIVFGGRLYASTGGGGNAAQIWRSVNGLNWASVVTAGFSDPDTTDITALATYNGMIYAGAANQVDGVQIWRSFNGDSNSWTQQAAPVISATLAPAITGFAEFDGALYAAVQSDDPAQIWRSFGGSWSAVVSDGFGDTGTTMNGGLATFSGYLYAAAGNVSAGAQLWRTNDGATWEQAVAPGAGDANNAFIEALFLFQNELYATTHNTSTGVEVWRTADGAIWEQVNQDGFGDANNGASNGSNATAHFGGQLYVGTENVVDGGELWRMTPDIFYDVTLSSDDARAGVPGQTVTYTLTITNSGTVTDTFDLAVSGHGWSTTLSQTSVELAAGAAAPFSASVTIPANATASETDIATVTATSQADAQVSDVAILTTTCAVPPHRYFLAIVLR